MVVVEDEDDDHMSNFMMRMLAPSPPAKSMVEVEYLSRRLLTRYISEGRPPRATAKVSTHSSAKGSAEMQKGGEKMELETKL